MSLDAAGDALEDRRFEDALLDLLAAWRARRLPELARFVGELSAMFEPVLPGFEGRGEKGMHATWVRRATEQTASDLPALLRRVGRGKAAQTAEQLELLATWPADPRTTAMAVRLLEDRPYATSSGTQTVWRRLFRLLEAHADPGAAAALAALPVQQIFQPTERGLQMRERMTNVIAALAADPPAPLSAEETTAARRYAGRFEAATRSGAVLRAHVEANLGDDHGRIVYADWLLERGSKHAAQLIADLVASMARRKRAAADPEP